MKNLTLPKLLGLIGGFLVVVLVIAVMIVRAGGHPGARPVTSKVYHHERLVASMPDLVPPTAQPTLVVARGDQSGPNNQRPAPPAPRSAPTDEVTRVTVDTSPPPPTASGAPAVDPMPQVNALDGKLAALTERVGALEASAAAAAALQRAREAEATAARSRAIARPVRSKTQTRMDGYKTMAVVGGRAWVRMPDGTEDSATTGDALPRPQVRSVSHDTGIIITSTDERIDPQ